MAVANFKLKTQAMRLRLRRELAAAPSGRRAGVRVMGRTIIENLMALSPVDTRRYRRGWQEAGRGAGVWDGKVNSLKPSKYHATAVNSMRLYVERLEDRRDALKRELDAMYPKGAPKNPRGGRYRDQQRKIATAEKRVTKARDELAELERDPYAVVFGAGRVIDGGKARLGLGKVSIRQKVYGGTGRIIDRKTSSTLHLKNMEPHAQILEWKRGVLRTATTAARNAGLIPVKRAYIAPLKKAGRR